MPSPRDTSLASLSANGSFDVVVVGGGINGIGVYRELALQGLRVLLVERGDFCSGCSAAPSRMIHGGLRYLENGEFDLVRESLAERDALLRNAPHFVRPLATTVPVTSMFSGTLNAMMSFIGRSGKPASRGALPIKLGLSLYDWVTRKRRALPRHQFRGAKATKAIWPQLTDDLRYSATYYDAWISHPERLGLELVQDTALASPTSVALNYAELSPMADGYRLADLRSGEILPVTTKVLVNATGAWVDETIGQLAPSRNNAGRLVSGTKGSHLILDNADLLQALNGQMIYFENDDGRICIVFPYLGNVLAGSTDIRVEQTKRVRCEPEERDYILASLRRVFPDIAVSPAQIAFSYSGIRPLPKSDHDFTGRISRGHHTMRLAGPVPQFCMVGGKWTTFRAFAEQTADEVLKELGQSRKTDTRDVAIGGGAGFTSGADDLQQALCRDFAITSARALHLTAHYGSNARAVLNHCAARSDDHPLASGCLYTAAEIGFLATREHVVTLADLVMRRTDLAITGQISTALITRIAAVLAAELGWTPDHTLSEQQALMDDLRDFHGVSLDMLQQRTDKRIPTCA
ncbi:glycerol-3-phosphate dehydrogenase/oxidase [Pararhodobacter oceanensis]|uniref:glycerol-3-phosphate dehydrogenase/oxidase n=1 Tax=Pararhodobacter oceanensis TaxID=2172121 RepID=UPI003A8D9CBC